jgi:hypothetical protein
MLVNSDWMVVAMTIVAIAWKKIQDGCCKVYLMILLQFIQISEGAQQSEQGELEP